MAGLRPDQVQMIEQVQPYQLSDPERDSWSVVHQSMEFVRQLNAVQFNQPCVGAWAHLAHPEVIVDSPFTVQGMTVDPAGLIDPSRRIATFRLVGPEVEAPQVRANPNIAFDLVSRFGEPPADDDDTFGHRGQLAVIVVRHLIEGFEGSLGLRASQAVDQWQPEARIAAAATLRERPTREPLQDANARPWADDAREALAESDAGIATAQDGQELIIIVKADDEILVRTVPAASALNPRQPQGTGAEDAAHSAAAQWGLPDFIFPPKKRRTGSGTRELSDGLVFLGETGLILQVKSRHDATDRPEREKAWFLKKINEAGRQAAGTLRLLQRQPETMTNQRGREIVIDGNHGTWTAVTIMDHPNVPPGVVPPTSTGSLPMVTLMRRDWEFLFTQLGSTAAVTAYLQRVAGDSEKLGDEPARYFDLAGKDRAAEPEPLTSPWAATLTSSPTSTPLLPQEPATLSQGQVMFRVMLDDIAECSPTLTERDRLALLAQLDHLPVVYQSAIGDRLLDLLQRATAVNVGHVKTDYRWVTDGKRSRQVAFCVANQLSEQLQEIFRQRLLLQHLRMSAFTWTEERVTTGVLLTPNFVDHRGWDTSVYALIGDFDTTEEGVAAMESLFNSTAATD